MYELILEPWGDRPQNFWPTSTTYGSSSTATTAPSDGSTSAIARLSTPQHA